MSTKAQRWARKRNWHKARLLSALTVCYNDVLTKDEYETLNKIRTTLNSIITAWDNNNAKSKEQYLRNVKY